MSNKAFIKWFVVILILGSIFTAYKRYVSPSPTPEILVTPTVTPTPPPPEGVVPVTLNAVPGSPLKQQGNVSLIDNGDSVTVTVVLSADSASVTNPQPIHVHTGTCAEPGPVVYPLTNVLGGESQTVLKVTMPTLLATGTLINVHKSQEEPNVYTACGEFPDITPTQESSGETGESMQDAK